VALAGLPIQERQIVLDLLSQIRQRMLTPEKIREWDAKEIFPEEAIRELLGPEIGLQLLFLPEEYGGMGGGARDVAAVSEQLGKICLGIATGFLVIHLGSDPILVGGTDEQKRKWLGRLAEEGSIVAYAVTEPEAGSNLAALTTTATPVVSDDGVVTGYRISGNKQFISNGSYADFLTVLAQTPQGPAFFVVEKNMPGFTAGKPEEKHGIRSSNTAPLVFDDVLVPAENLIGGVPGKGLDQANEVFGFTRLMVASCALGAGTSAVDKVVAYAKERVQFGSPLLEKQGYTHKLVLPHLAKLEAARAYIESVTTRLDSGEADLQVEGAIAKLFTTETANSAAEAAIQALGGYGYVREYDVEKIKRDVKITCIYEGTSEMMQFIISVFRWRSTVQSKGGLYGLLAERLDSVAEARSDLKADVLASLVRLLNRLIQEIHSSKGTRQQHVMFRMAEFAAAVETAAALTEKVAAYGVVSGYGAFAQPDDGSPNDVYLTLCARVNTALVAQTAFTAANEILFGSGLWSPEQARAILDVAGFDYALSQAGLIPDLDALRSTI
jgi:alkylation response protein AidB-like acyl-CoA dehydrogenase